MHELRGGEAVVQLHQVQVLGADARSRVGGLDRPPGYGVDVGERLNVAGAGIGRQHARGHLDRAILHHRAEGLQLRGSGDDALRPLARP